MAAIVIAEDEPHIARLIKFKLEKEGHEIHWENDGGAALKRIEEVKPELIILDIMMPVMDGYQVLQAVKDNPDLKDIPVVMLTAKGQEKDIVRGIQMGAEDYIVKPFHPAELAARVEKVLSR
jgi:DNA-binding response OmpR family regulator